MVLGTAVGAWRTHDRPELLESPGALDAGLVDSGADVYVVCAPVTCHRALLLSSGCRVVSSVVLDDVIGSGVSTWFRWVSVTLLTFDEL